MTTIIGLRPPKGLDCIIMAADRQASSLAEDGEVVETSETRKLVCGRSLAIGVAGTLDASMRKFLNVMSRKPQRAEPLVQRAIQRYREEPANQELRWVREPDFPEVAYLNAHAQRGAEPGEDDTAEFLLATRLEGLGLYRIDAYGNLSKAPGVHEFEYLVIGSGRKRAKQHIDDEISRGRLDPSSFDHRQAMRLLVDTLAYAQKDPGTGGLIHAAIVTPYAVEDYGDRLRDALSRAQDEEFKTIWDEQESLLRRASPPEPSATPPDQKQ